MLVDEMWAGMIHAWIEGCMSTDKRCGRECFIHKNGVVLDNSRPGRCFQFEGMLRGRDVDCQIVPLFSHAWLPFSVSHHPK